jgi:sodium-dependent phosphate transporter
MELGAAITVLLASQCEHCHSQPDHQLTNTDGLPVSTTMCITGATAGVGIVSGGCKLSFVVFGFDPLTFSVKAVNWRAFGWIFAGWVITVPVCPPDYS